MWVADYSFSRPDLAALAAAGCSGIVRYALDMPGGGHKAVDKSEIDTAVGLGMTVTIVQESTNQPAMGGFPAGVAEARAANARMDTVGYPRDCWLYYAAEDPNVLPQSAWPTVESYFRGVASVRGRLPGGYGSKALLDHLAGLGLITGKWAVDPWGGHAGCHLAQYAAAVPPGFTNDVDGNLVLAADYGQHPRPGSAAAHVRQSTEEHTSAMSVIYGPDSQCHMVVVNPQGGVDHYHDADVNKVLAGTSAIDHLGGAAKAVCGQFWTPDNRYYVIAVHGTDDHLYRVTYDSQAPAGTPGWGKWGQLAVQLSPPSGATGPQGPVGPSGPSYDDKWIHDELAGIKNAITG